MLPPGLTYEGPLEEAARGGDSSWVEYQKVKLYTNAFIIVDDTKVSEDPYTIERNNSVSDSFCRLQVLLGYKKRGFGMGLYVLDLDSVV